MKALLPRIKEVAREFGFEWRVIASFIEVETGGRGFDPATKKIIIQFEPAWFRKHEPYAPSGNWSVNKVDVQSKEWIAFNNAFAINKESAMKSTSIGLGQIMGFHYARLGYKSVGEMWDDAKKSIDRQLWQICQFLKTDRKLLIAIQQKDWHTVASIYNGSGYKELAKKYGRVAYDISMERSYNKWLLEN